MQFNLEPQDDHERELVASLAKYQGTVTLHKGVSVGDCRGGYLRNFGERDNVLAVRIGRERTSNATEGGTDA